MKDESSPSKSVIFHSGKLRNTFALTHRDPSHKLLFKSPVLVQRMRSAAGIETLPDPGRGPGLNHGQTDSKTESVRSLSQLFWRWMTIQLSFVLLKRS